MSLQTIEIALPSDLIEQIDAEVGSDHRSEFFAQLASKAVQHKILSTTRTSLEDEIAKGPNTSRFKPITIRGEPISDTIARDRGNL